MRKGFYAFSSGLPEQTSLAQLSKSFPAMRNPWQCCMSPSPENSMESIIASPSVSTYSLYWIQFILSDLYFSVIVLYLWSADCKQSNQPPGFWLLVCHLLYNATVQTSCSGKEKMIDGLNLFLWKKNLWSIKIVKWQCLSLVVCFCVWLKCHISSLVPESDSC